MLCMICGQPLNRPDWVCFRCKRAYNLPNDVGSWPEWARFLLREEKTRRRRLRTGPVEICFSDFDEEDQDRLEAVLYGAKNDDAIG